MSITKQLNYAVLLVTFGKCLYNILHIVAFLRIKYKLSHLNFVVQDFLQYTPMYLRQNLTHFDLKKMNK